LAPERAHAAVHAAFEEIAAIHCLMSFHEAGSDVSQLNREAHLKAVAVDRRTFAVLTRAAEISRNSDGAFDVTVAPALVRRGILPKPAAAPVPDETAVWRDVGLLDGGKIRFAKPLWIDLGGIAKGYAVDCAINVLRAFSPIQASVNAGGDLRVIGPQSECVRLVPDHCQTDKAAMVQLESGALASSCGQMSGRRIGGMPDGPHVDARCGRLVHPTQFVSVAAPNCMDADALTKVVMEKGNSSAAVLAQYGAHALIHDAPFGWRTVSGSA
ncbi:MAG: FAD:protein FMN transferase, partial [Alphaproteobacteria bacterium]|nr:FAD:protein FMN transferase [Alphaproteobacteria bacterium]